MPVPSAPQERTAGTTGAKTYHRLAQAKKSDYVKLDLLALNDFHGNLEPPTGSSGNIPGITNVTGTKAGGAAYLASALKKERKKSRAAGATPLTVAAGDLIGAQPAALGGLPRRADHHGDEHDGPRRRRRWATTSSTRASTSCCAWRRAAAWPTATVRTAQDSCPAGQTFKGADFPYLGANVFWKNKAGHKRATPFKPYKIFKVDGQKVGFIGMTLEDTDTIVGPGRDRRRRLPRRGARPPTRWCPS